jgi:hypothetical protein
MPPEFRIALLGQGFMGKAHSNAYVQAPHFFDLPYRVVRKVICGRDAASLSAMADRWGWEETATDWRAVVEREGGRFAARMTVRSRRCGADRQDNPRSSRSRCRSPKRRRWLTPPAWRRARLVQLRRAGYRPFARR